MSISADWLSVNGIGIGAFVLAAGLCVSGNWIIHEPLKIKRKPVVRWLNIWNTIEAVKDQLKPPVSNKLLFSGEIKTMVVGGPNERDDFHVEMGEELFYQLKGRMNVIIINPNNNQRETIAIEEGQFFLLPAGVPHSPQRFANTIGIVFERERLRNEVDCLRWYKDGEENEIFYQECFKCEDLGSQLKVVIDRYRQIKETLPQSFQWPNDYASKAIRSYEDYVKRKKIHMPIPISLSSIVDETIFGLRVVYNSEFKLQVIRGKVDADISIENGLKEVFFWQMTGESTISFDFGQFTINGDEVVIVNSDESVFHIDSHRPDTTLIIVSNKMSL
jgi:3-hydroxyanthranilate 3,4-dioxygenase